MFHYAHTYFFIVVFMTHPIQYYCIHVHRECYFYCLAGKVLSGKRWIVLKGILFSGKKEGGKEEKKETKKGWFLFVSVWLEWVSEWAKGLLDELCATANDDDDCWSVCGCGATARKTCQQLKHHHHQNHPFQYITVQLYHHHRQSTKACWKAGWLDWFPFFSGKKAWTKKSLFRLTLFLAPSSASKSNGVWNTELSTFSPLALLTTSSKDIFHKSLCKVIRLERVG